MKRSKYKRFFLDAPVVAMKDCFQYNDFININQVRNNYFFLFMITGSLSCKKKVDFLLLIYS